MMKHNNGLNPDWHFRCRFIASQLSSMLPRIWLCFGSIPGIENLNNIRINLENRG
jgi:hypothetical protein